MWRHIRQILQIILPTILSNGTILSQTTKWSVTYYLVHTTLKLQPNDRNFRTHTRMKFPILSWSKSKVHAFLVIFLHTTLYKMKSRDVANHKCTKCIPFIYYALIYVQGWRHYKCAMHKCAYTCYMWDTRLMSSDSQPLVFYLVLHCLNKVNRSIY